MERRESGKAGRKIHRVDFKDFRIMVLAAGKGTRLRPLTYQMPKPMIPIVNRPVLSYVFGNLKKQGFRNFVCNLHTHPEKIKNYFGDGSGFGINIEYSDERVLMGNAGGLKKVEKFFKNGTFAVVSGDGFSEIDLRKVVEFHKAKKSFATMVLKKLDSPIPFGITQIFSSGKIKRFMEKPSITDFVDSTVNTGIYVFEPEVLNLIPEGKFYDFGGDLWPKLLRLRYPIYGFVTKAYWCDVGNLESYKQTQMDILGGRVKIEMPGKMVKNSIWIEKGAKIARGVKIIPPVLIGRKTFIDKKARIGPFVTIGKNCRVGEAVALKNAILWDDAVIDKFAKINNCIIGYGAVIKESISLFEGTVVTKEEL
ncbi:MAG: NDP-sugar synthase [Elusimicrobia bacterium]|nr:NDP-sugar synthase [Elusimicrobiota bacterium]